METTLSNEQIEILDGIREKLEFTYIKTTIKYISCLLDYILEKQNGLITPEKERFFEQDLVDLLIIEEKLSNSAEIYQ